MEVEQWRGHYIQVTTEQRGDQTFERAYIRGGISVIPITADGRVRFIKEHDWSQEAVRTKLVTGYVEDDEDPAECAMRELAAELGITADRWELFLLSMSEEGTVRKAQHFFVARDLHYGTPHPDAGERILGHVDLTTAAIRALALGGEFGSTATAYALMRFVG